MTALLSRHAFRHVVFPGAFPESGPAIDFAPAPPMGQRRVPAAHGNPLSADEWSSLRWLYEQASLDISHYRPESLMRRIPACLRALRVQTLQAAKSAIQRDLRLLRIALDALVIGVTSFFRDEPVFTLLADRVLPNLLARRKKLRVWSAGCSDGSELYSVAMLLAEHSRLEDALLLGTDCRPDAIARAKHGCYSASAIENVPLPLASRYFQVDGAGWRVREDLRNRLRWRTSNILGIREPGIWDVILCRNLSIYLQPDAVAALWSRLRECLQPGGVLVLGKAERPTPAWGMEPLGPCIYQQGVGL